MNQELTQEQEMSPEEAMASLGMATHLGEQMLSSQLMPQAPAEAPESPETAPGEAEGQEQAPDIEGMVEAKIGELREEMLTAIKDEVSSIKDSIQEALKDDE